jgi:hypothetical protein
MRAHLTHISIANAGRMVPIRARYIPALESDDSNEVLVNDPGVIINRVTVWNLGGTSPTIVSNGVKLPSKLLLEHIP